MLQIARQAPTIESIIAAHAALRAQGPLVQCLTNVVSANFMANVLLAAGASPAMVDNPEEAVGFASVAGAVLVNLGTPTTAQVQSMRLAVQAADDIGKPWVLDPIGAGALPWRGAIAAELLASRPTVIRGNASEIIGLAGLGNSNAKGFDSSNDPADAVPAALSLLAHASCVSASGPIDHVVGKVQDDQGNLAHYLLRIAGGSALLPRVTASGCALGALVAAYAAVAQNSFCAVAAAHVHFALAAEYAERQARGPGSFVPAFLDGLDLVDARLIRAKGQVEGVKL
ncbi:hydroxyethylthiazole kinase [Pseudomonas sp. M47T1]|uniref:hydroxyethylthiazole kinase n=1 Tax=Pseudomonas sp. M47T1 TaxID=1179778 RepID=UPI000260785A|nr:hydroxyethylthiazole kinase [Pseudomonas sp. M47T1]EIK97114.1 hydroxyethylthiazole kinase [Pseudomonas sp. M47T1]